MKPLIETGRCSACQQPAERGRSGGWWHEAGAGCGQNPARFVPDDQAEERQQQSPRDRQIRHPGRDR